MTSEAELLRLIDQQMEAGQDEMRRILDTAFYRSEGPPLFASFYGRPSRTRRIVWRVRGYLSTLWLALRGADLREDDDDEG